VIGGWNIWSNGYISTNHSFTASTTTITVTESGSVAAGVWPHMVVSVGGTQVGQANVTSTSLSNYAFTFNASAGTKESASLSITTTLSMARTGTSSSISSS
jgi:hypothetical protein